jgi:c-di-GMP-binding flagellar brake protein YcgR
MQTPEQNHNSNERRKFDRLSVYSFMHATAALRDSAAPQQTDTGEDGQSWTGLLEDISSNGAQVILPAGCQKHLNEQQDVVVRIKTTFLEDVNIEVTAQVKYIVPAQTHNGMQVGVQFTALEKNPKAKDAILKIYEYGQKLKAVGEQQAEQMAAQKN